MNQQLIAAQRFNQQEKAYLIAYNQAVSAVNWGMKYPWRHQSGWQCQTIVAGRFRTCLYYEAQAGQALLYGQSEQWAGYAPVRIYRLLSVQAEATPQERFVPLAQGWLDFCPWRSACEQEKSGEINEENQE